MSANNIMDVFLAVKVDESESDDLAKLLDTLQRISALQASFTATGGIDLNIDVDTKDIENKIDDLKRFLEEDFDIDTRVISDIKSDTEYIISRLWSVTSPSASVDHLTERFARLGKDPSDIATTFISNIKNAEIFESRYEDIGTGKQAVLESVKSIAGRVAKNLKEGIFDDWTQRSIGLIESMQQKRSDVSARTLDLITNLMAGIEEKFQEDITGIGRGKVKVSGGMAVGAQRQFVGLIESQRRGEWEDLIKAKSRSEFKIRKELKDQIIRAGLGLLSPAEEKSLAGEALKGFDPKIHHIPKAEMMTEEIKNLMIEMVKADDETKDEEELWRAMYKKLIRPDELVQINQRLIQEFLDDSTDDKREFKKSIVKEAQSIYTSPEYAGLIADDLITAMREMNEADLIGRDFFTIYEEWKRIEKWSDKLIGEQKYGIEQFRTFVKSGTGVSPQIRKGITDIETEELLEEMEKRRADKGFRSVGFKVNTIMLKLADLEEKIAKEKDVLSKDKYELEMGSLRDYLAEIMEEVKNG